MLEDLDIDNRDNQRGNVARIAGSMAIQLAESPFQLSGSTIHG
jgi:hypothetical protein